MKRITTLIATLITISFAFAAMSTAQEASTPPQITMGNGEFNSIEINGLTRGEIERTFSEVRVDGANVSTFRTNSTTITFPEVLIEENGWIVLHPVIDGRPNGDMVSGFAYVSEGLNKNVALQMDHPADAGRKFIVMLHSDVDEDRIFDFVFVEDGINVEDKAVFEGTRMIAHVISVP